MITFEWRIKNLSPRQIAGRDQVVAQIHFELVATDDKNGRSQSLHGSYSPPLDSIGPDFVDYADLTPDTVEAWLEASPAADDLKAQVAGALTDATAQDAPLPWEQG